MGRRREGGGRGGGGEGGGRTNERPGTDYVTGGPMRGLNKKCTDGASTQTDRLTDLMGTVGPIQ